MDLHISESKLIKASYSADTKSKNLIKDTLNIDLDYLKQTYTTSNKLPTCYTINVILLKKFLKDLKLIVGCSEEQLKKNLEKLNKDDLLALTEAYKKSIGLKLLCKFN